MFVFYLMHLMHWYHKCPIVLSTPHDFCLCVKKNNIYVQNENGMLEKWLYLNREYVVQDEFPISANTNYICRDTHIGSKFHVYKNGSWFCDNIELTHVTDEKVCYG